VAMANPAFNDLSAMFKELYPDGEVESAALHECSLAKRITKKADFFGDELHWPLPYAPGAGRSHDFATALANVGPPKAKRWTLTHKSDYSVWTIDDRAIAASENNRGAFVAEQKIYADMHLANMGRSYSVGLYGRVGGAIGQIATGGIAGAVATLKYPHDVRNFYESQKIDVSAANDSTAAARAGSPLTVQSVDYDAGTVTFTAGIVATVAAAVAGDYLIPDGDAAIAMSGLQEWIPLSTAGLGTAFNGVTRSAEPQRLAGWRVDNPNGDPAENLITLGQKVSIGGPGPNQLVVVNPIHYGSLVKSLSSKIVYQRQGKKSEEMVVGATGVYVGLSSGVAEIFTDADCPGGLGWLLDMDTWVFHSLKEVPHIVMTDGLKALRGANYDGVEVRARWWGDLLCTMPFRNGTFSTLV
jgi:hypothetical protein